MASLYEQAEATHDANIAREGKAWRERMTPKQAEEWAIAQMAVERSHTTLMHTAVAVEAQRRRVERLSNPHEVAVRVAVARERMGE